MDSLPSPHSLDAMEQTDRHPVVSFISAFFWVIRTPQLYKSSVVSHTDRRFFITLVYLLSWVKALVAFATITIPRLIYSLLSYSMTLTVRMDAD